MKYDDFLSTLGDFGLYQFLAFFSLAFTSFMSALEIMTLTLFLQVPKYACIWPLPPGISNVTIIETFNTLLNASNSTTKQLNHPLINTCKVPSNNGTFLNCEQWIYDRSQLKSSLVTEFDMVCDRKYYPSLIFMVYFGGVVVAMGLNILGDYIGRRMFIIIMAIWETVMSILLIVVPGLVPQIILRFLRGWSAGFFMIGLGLMTEIVSPRYRSVLGNVYWVFWMIGMMFSGLFGFLGREWRIIKLYSLIPAVVYLGYIWVLPESPRWLILKGRRKEADKIFRSIARWNRITINETDLANLEVKEEPTGRFLEIFMNPNTLRKTLTLVFTTWTFCFGYYGITTDTSFFHSNMFISVFLQGLVENIGPPVGGFIAHRWGCRIPLIIIVVVIAGILVLLPVVHHHGLTMVGWVVGLLAKIILLTGFCWNDYINASIHPTSIRAGGLTVVCVLGNSANMVGSFVQQLKHVKYYLPGVVMAAHYLISAVLIYLYIPELSHCPLSETIQQSERLKPGNEKAWTQEMESAVFTLDVNMNDEASIELNPKITRENECNGENGSKM